MREILGLVEEKVYYNIIALIYACVDDGNPLFLAKLLGEKNAFDEIRKTVNFLDFISNYQTNHFNPIAITTGGYIFRDHFQVAALLLSKINKIEVIYKKIPVEEKIFDKDWASKFLSSDELSELDSFWSSFKTIIIATNTKS